MKILNWGISPELKKEAEEHYRTKFAISLKDRDPLTIIREITFDGVAPNIEIKDIENLFNFVESRLLKGRIKGVGLEVGSGPATFSSVLAKRDSVEKMYAVEVCQPIVELLMSKVTDYVLDGKSDKVISVVGSFDNMELPDKSVDFVFDFFSLHHSNNLERTLKECHRVLKKEGFIFCFDKARPDYFTSDDLNELLDAEYNYDFKKQMRMPLNQRFTRRMNDEKEYRLKDWRQAFVQAGFKKVQYFYLSKTTGGSRISQAVRSSIAFMPVRFQTAISWLLPNPRRRHKFILASQPRVFTQKVNPFPKEISFLAVYK